MADAMRYDEDFPASKPTRNPAKPYTYKEYYSWGEDVRCELIDGIVHKMAGAGQWHQRTAVQIVRKLEDWLEGKPCKVFMAPFDVRLFPPADKNDDSDKTVVQPDVLVVCDPEKLSDDRACRGAPDFIVEIISQGTRGKDFGIKRNLYEKAGVAEYWIVEKDAVYVNLLVEGAYRETMHELSAELELEVGVLPGCRIGFRVPPGN